MCPMMCSPQVLKVTKAHLDPLDPRALQVPQDHLEAEDLKALGSQTCSMASVQVRRVPHRTMVRWLERLMRRPGITILHQQNL